MCSFPAEPVKSVAFLIQYGTVVNDFHVGLDRLVLCFGIPEVKLKKVTGKAGISHDIDAFGVIGLAIADCLCSVTHARGLITLCVSWP